MRKPGYRILPHTAEVALRLRGPTWAEFYRSAAEGLLEIYGVRKGPPGGRRLVRSVSGGGPEETLVAWLNEIVYLVSAERWLPSRVRILAAGPSRVRAAFLGGPLGLRASIATEVKAATHNELRVRRRGEAWTADVVLDV